MSVFLPSDVLDQFASNVELVLNASTPTGQFTRSSYRFTLEAEPTSTPDGLYFLEMRSIQPHLRRWGDGSQITDSVIAVRLMYGRPGGTGGGDRQTVMRNAADDCSKLADVCENPDNYGSSTSGIRTVTFAGAVPVSEVKLGEIWEVRFTCQWESDMDTTTVQDDTEANLIVDGINTGSIQLIAVQTNSFATGSQAFVREPTIWRNYRLDKDDTQTPDNITIVAALGGGNWLAEWYENQSTGTITSTVV